MSEEVKWKVYENTPTGEFIDRYRKDMYEILHRSLPLLQPFELEEGINYSINKAYQGHNVVIDNNYTKRKAEIDLLDLANQLLEGKYIMTTSGVLFQKHGMVKNPFYNFIQYLVDKRDEAKEIIRFHVMHFMVVLVIGVLYSIIYSWLQLLLVKEEDVYQLL